MSKYLNNFSKGKKLKHIPSSTSCINNVKGLLLLIQPCGHLTKLGYNVLNFEYICEFILLTFSEFIFTCALE